MLDRPGAPLADALRETTERWIDAFDAALAGRSAAGLSALFVADSHWRNLFGLSWHFATFSGNATVVAELLARGAEARASKFPHRSGAAGAAQRRGRRARRGRGDLRLRHGQRPGLWRSPAAAPAGWASRKPGPFPPRSISMPSARRARAARPRTSTTRDFAGPDWLEARQAEGAYDDRDPDVLIVGGGHAGISVAVEAQSYRAYRAGDRPRGARIGDNWRLRYRGLKLHNKTPVNHLRYLPFPTTFPDYIPKDKIANWLESYVDIMEVDFWTRSAFDGADLRRGLAALDRAADARRRGAHASPETHRARDQRQRHAEHSRASKASRISRARCCIPAASRRAGNGPDGP